MFRIFKTKLINKLFILFAIIIIIPTGVVSLLLSDLITKNYIDQVCTSLNSGKDFVNSIFTHNKDWVTGSVLKIKDDSQVLHILKTLKKEGNSQKDLFSYFKLRYDMDFLYISDESGSKTNFYSEKIEKINFHAENYIEEPVITFDGSNFICYAGLFLNSGENNIKLITGKVIDKYTIYEFCKISGIEFTVLTESDDSYKNVYSTIYDDYGFLLEKGVIELGTEEVKRDDITLLNYMGKMCRVRFYSPDHFEKGYRAVFSKLENRKLIKSAWEKFLYMFFAFALLMMIFWAFINSKVIKPIILLLQGIGKVTVQIENNRPIEPIIIKSRDEIGQLTSSFNDMSSRLGRSFSRINFLQNYLLNIIESMPSALIAVDNSGKVTQWNKTAEYYTSSSAKFSKGTEIWEIISDLGIYKDEILKLINQHEHKQIYREPYRDGEKKNINIHLYPLSANGVSGSVIRIDDITDLKKKEEQLRQAQKMETIGTLAGGIAHDFNNILSGIVGVVSILKYKMSKNIKMDDDQYLDYLDIMEKSGERAGDIVQRLLTLSKKQNTNLEKVEVKEVIRQVIKICKNTFDKTILIEEINTKTDLSVYADFTQIEQILLNLSINAYHAMTIMKGQSQFRGGKLIYKIEDTELEKEMEKFKDSEDKREFICISVKDTGIGMDKHTIKQIFEPFFSTKDKSVGTGLGLTIVQNIIQQFGGFIDVDSTPGEGTEFRIYLPKYTQTGEVYENTKPKTITKGSGTILVIDDEPVLRELARTMLNQAGYEVITAEDGILGLEIYKEKMNEIDAILLDIVLPNKNGKETYKDLRRINDDIKVIVTSGFAKDKRVEAILKLGAQNFIQKPFTIYGLTEKFYELLVKKDIDETEKETS